jgi:Spy/CpxP family protein refolding chaperone
MRKTLLILGMLFGIATISFAQDKGKRGEGRTPAKPEERAKRMTENLKTKLNLNDEQQSKIFSIYLEQAKKTDSLRNTAGEQKDKFVQMRAISTSGQSKINAVLNADQQKTFKALQEERMKNRGPGPERKK